MAYNENQNESALPVGDNAQRSSADHLPRYFRTDSNKKFLSATLDQLLNPGVAEKISAYYGRRIAKARSQSDTYVDDVSEDRTNYQLEPAVIVKDELANVNFYKDYNDYKNQINAFGGFTENADVLNRQEYYSWSPKINWDKFTNFREYYWLPNGPIGIGIAGQAKDIESEFTVTSKDNIDNKSYLFTPDGLTSNPTLKLYRGQTYTFDINAPGMPLTFRTSRSLDAEVLYTTGLDDSTGTTDVGKITFEVDLNAPDTLYYVNGNDINASGLIKIYDVVENSEIDVEAEIIGKQNYTMSNGQKLSNGMKVYFQGTVTPEKYSKGEWYVEGVGEEITLIDTNQLQIPGSYATDKPVLFDSENFDRFPFSNANSYAEAKDYICINKASKNLNSWSRYNRWFHKDVIETTASINGITAEIDQASRAKRPIIEFDADIKLYNYGTVAKADIDLIDTFTKDAMSTVEGSIGYNIDGIEVVHGMRVLFAADTDSMVAGKIYKVNFITHNNVRQISLVEEADTTPLENEVVMVRKGITEQGNLWWYNGTTWKSCQPKTAINQTPMFDLYDSSGYSFSNTTYYPSTTFEGSKLFSYRKGTGANDVELGFPLTYRALENTGDIVFDFNISSETYQYQSGTDVMTASTDVGLLRKYKDRTTFDYVGPWEKGYVPSEQLVARQYIVDTQTNDFAIDVYDRSGDLNDLWYRVYVNDVHQKDLVDFTILRLNGIAFVNFINPLKEGDILVIKTRSATRKNANGHYEFPINLERNPTNENISSFTLGEVNDHVQSITTNHDEWIGKFPGTSNLRDLGNITPYGNKFVQHTGLINLSLYHITDDKANIIKALKYSRREYAKFKRMFIQTIETLGFDGQLNVHFEKVIKELNKNKTNDMAYYFSDMIGHGTYNLVEHTVVDPDQGYWSMSKNFNLRELGNEAVGVYVNDVCLVEGQDYIYETGFESFVKITKKLVAGDKIKIYEYNSTEGSYIPPTPTKLGLYPKFVPSKFTDDSYVTPVDVIQGHDGSIFKAYGDYRDDLILELEKRIYNNIKVQYDKNLVNIHELLSGEFRSTGIMGWALDKAMISDFVDWLRVIGNPDYTDHDFYDRSNSFTFNYASTLTPNGNKSRGYWRAVYKDAYDTDRPHTHPWEMLGFSIKPTWWETVYGSAPYTSENKILWKDLEQGKIAEPGKPVQYVANYKRPGLTTHIPVDDGGNLLSPLDSNYAKQFTSINTNASFRFGDQSPTETAWRRSSEYPFSLIVGWLLTQPSKIMGLGWDRSRVIRNAAGLVVYKDTSKSMRPTDIVYPNTILNETRIYTAGLVNYIHEYMASKNLGVYEKYKTDFKGVINQLGFKIGGFTAKNKFKLILDSRTPFNEGNVFVPEENYDIFLNTSSTTQLLSYSGVIIEKKAEGFVLRGYDNSNPYFNYYTPTRFANDPVINIGGVSESFVDWSANKFYAVGQIVSFGKDYYTTKIAHESTADFVVDNFQKLPELPTVGGRNAVFSKNFNIGINQEPEELLYGTTLRTIQEVVDFLLGYGEYLKTQGFVFENFNPDINLVENWSTSAKEFMFWTTQGWKADSVITVSPGANKLVLEKEYNVADDLFNGYYDYSLFKADGKKLLPEFAKVFRSNENKIVLTTKNTADGIFAIKVPLVQKEHVCIIDNTTVFKDVVYDTGPGYRQERVKVLGYRSDAWNGGFNIPGFIYDEANTNTWEAYKDYAIGDTVKYKEFFYVAKVKIPGTNVFNNEEWEKLQRRPQSGLIANLDYKANQFGDFYDLDTDNFDTQQQKIAQHLIGYQKRKYLENIITDDVSQYKFYQGFIQDKGTKNSLTKLFDALSNSETDSLEFFEEWAIRLGQYGSSESFDEVEFTLDESKFRLSPQPIELVATTTGQETDLVYRQRPFEVYLKSKDYDHKPFPTRSTLKYVHTTAGYVNEQDVKTKVAVYNDILTLDLTSINVGDYIWVGQKGLSWDVLKYVRTDSRVLAVAKRDTDVVITLNEQARFDVDEIIGLVDVTGAEKFYKVKSVELKDIICHANGETEEVETANGFITEFRTAKAPDFDNANIILSNQNLKVGETLWVDKDANSNWLVLKNTPQFANQQIISNVEAGDNAQEFGKVIAADERNTVLCVGAFEGNKVYIFKRYTDTVGYVHIQTIEPPQNLYTGDGSFGKALSISADAEFIVIGAPTASNVKTKFVETYSQASTYAPKDIVSYKEQIWQANYDIEAALGTYTFNSFYTSHDVEHAAYDNATGYPTTVYAIRGNYKFDGATTHVLIRAPRVQYIGSAINDKIDIQWNQYSQNYPNGTLPFGQTGPALNDFEGTKTITGKIDNILFVDNLLRTPQPGDIISTTTAIGTVERVIVDNVSQGLIYVKDVNGQFDPTGTLIYNSESMGTYEEVSFANPSDTFGGWWVIDGLQSFTTATKEITIPNLVIADYITSAESKTAEVYGNTMDDVYTANQDINNPTRGGRIGNLSYYDTFGMPQLQPYWFVRAPKVVTDNLSVADNFTFKINRLLGGDPATVWDPSAIGLSFDYLDQPHTVYDLWDGFIDITYTNFSAPPASQPFIPQVGETVIEDFTGATGEVAFVQDNLLGARVYIKNMTGTFSYGNNFNATGNLSIVTGLGFNRLSGRIEATDLTTNYLGKMIVVRNNDSTLLQIASPSFRNEVEMQFYKNRTVTGVPRSANIPNPLNKDWTQLYNLPADSEGTASTFTNEGMYFVYNKTGSGEYKFNKGYVNLQRHNNAFLGNQIELCKKDTLYRLFVSSPGDATPTNAGRIHFVKKGFEGTTEYEWDNGQDRNFRGAFDSNEPYYTDEIVIYNGSLFRSLTNQAAGAFANSNWSVLNTGVDYIGYIPNDLNITVTGDQIFNEFDSSSSMVNFAHPFTTSRDGDVIVTVADYTDQYPQIGIYRYNDGHFEFYQTIATPDAVINTFFDQDTTQFDNNNTDFRVQAPDTKFASAISVSDDGDWLAVGAPLDDEKSNDNGKVYLYKNTDNVFTLHQLLYSPDNTVAERFGQALDFAKGTLMVSAQGGDLSSFTTFDNITTTFDNNLTQFKYTNKDSGQVFVYQLVGGSMLYAEKFAYNNPNVERFGEFILARDNHVYVSMPELNVNAEQNFIGTVIDFKRDRLKLPWETLREPISQVDLTKFKGVFIYNKDGTGFNNQLDYIDPVQGKIAGPADEEIRFKVPYDPAIYTTATNGLNVDSENYWGTEHVGRLWWDISKVKWIDNYQGNIIYNTANFNKMFTGSSVDVYEWVETDLTPERWDATADTEEGLVKGISGTSAYGSAAFVTKRLYDNVSGNFYNKYYYWVKNKKVLPQVTFRKTTAFDVAQLIQDPAGQNYKFVAIYGNDRFGLYNCKSLVEGTKKAINFRYWTIDNQSVDLHNEYQLISEGLKTSKPNQDIERKWYDSLIGSDSMNRPVPDPELSEKQKWGVLNRPRQSMFKNRPEALKQTIERINRVLKENLIVDELDFTKLLDKDPQPTLLSRRFDIAVDTIEELGFIGVAKVKQAILTPTFTDGRLTDVTITDPGSGYKTVPTIEFIQIGDGVNAQIEMTLNANGGIATVTIRNPGKEYASTTQINVRTFSALVKSDSTVSNKWSVYEYNKATGAYSRFSTQSYDVSEWWEYADWYAKGYNQFTTVDEVVNESYQLTSLNDSIGDIIKINNVGTGGWLLLEKTSDNVAVDYTTNYTTIGRQNGTIQFKVALYDPKTSNVGFDGLSYDTSFYDNQPTIELRKILEAIRDDIFVEGLEVEYNKLFVASVRYAFSEQANIDWAFKTSFIKAKHNAGDLEQKVTFQNDNLPSYEEFVKETKPYKTKIREYLSNYTKKDDTNSTVTDFDVPPAYDDVSQRIEPGAMKVRDNVIISTGGVTSNYPNKYWADNVGFEITNVNITNSGKGYQDIPVVRFVGGGGTGAKGIAKLGVGGSVVSIEITNTGKGYLSAPLVEIDGSLSTTDGVAAKASAVLGNSKARSVHVRVKFDRVTGTYFVTTLNNNETFTGNNSKTIFDLTYPMDLRSTEFSISVDNIEVLKSDYAVSNIAYNDKSYTRYKGRIEFNNPPANNSSIVVTYKKAIDMLQAQDRINLFYNPVTGQLGKDVAQLLDGIDYGGVEVKSFNFGTGTGWGNEPYYTTSYDSYDNTYDDEVFQLDGSTLSLTLSKALESGVQYNVYYKDSANPAKGFVRLDDPNYDGSTTGVAENPNAVMNPITGDGVQTTFLVDNDKIPTKANDVIIIRKSSSDGSFIPDPDAYDTLLSGGDMAYQNARGINAEEIVIDGDDFVSPTTSHGPEELVPGQLLDSVNIKVYDRTVDGGSVIQNYNYTYEGSYTFKLNSYPASQRDIFVKANGNILDASKWSVNYQTKELTLKDVTLTAGQPVNIITMSTNGENILDSDTFEGDGSTSVFVTSVKWKDNLSFYITKDGETIDAVLAETDASYESKGLTLLRLSVAPEPGTIIQYVIYDSEVKSFASVTTDEFTGDGCTTAFTLGAAPFNKKPLQHNTIVQVGNKILKAGFNEQFTISATREYEVTKWQFAQASIPAETVKVFINNVEQTINQTYRWNRFNNTVELFVDTGQIGDTLDVFIIDHGEFDFGYFDSNNVYVETPTQIHLDTAPTSGEKVRVYTFANHDPLQIERQNYKVKTFTTVTVGTDDYVEYHQLTNGFIKLRDKALDTDYVWLTRNGTLLTPSVEYSVLEDRRTLRVEIDIAADDELEVIHFSNPVAIPKFGYSQFKDMLNRYHFKRLGDVTTYQLAKDLNYFDTNISVTNSDTLPEPNKERSIPGIIFINGERIEYYLKEDGLLRQLRRGTLGTGIATLHKSGTPVLDQSNKQTVPYKDKQLVQNFTADGSTNAVTLDFIPKNVNEFEVYVAGKRLRKNAISVFNPLTDLDSPEGDTTSPAEFSVDGVTSTLTLTDTPAINTKITVIRRIGQRWTDVGTALHLQENDIARFIRNGEVALPK